MIRRRTTLLLVLPAFAALAACSLAADVTPPPGYTPPTAAPTAAAAYPISMPNPRQGQQIYAEKCAPCHGDRGLGDGSQADQLPNPAPAIGSAEIARASSPAGWYQIVTEGNLDRFMPGFISSLSDDQRWDVVAYVYSLSAPAESVTQGQQIYQAECAACHGESGAGDGPQAAGLATPPAALNDPSRMAQRSAQELFQAAAAGIGADMPAFQGKLSEDQLWAVTSAVRGLWMGSTPPDATGAPAGSAVAQATPAPTGDLRATASPPVETTAAAMARGDITGQVSNGSGGAVPTSGKVTLHGFDGMEEAVTQTTDLQPDGSYRFSDVEMTSGLVFLTTLEHNGVFFNSDIAHAGEASPDITLPLVVFDTSTDASPVYAERMHIFFDFSVAGSVQVVELFVISNPTDRVIVAANPGEPVLRFDLPEGAANLQFQEGALGERFVETEAGFGDTQTISPGMGQQQILFGYELPYERALNLNLRVPMDVTAAVVMVPTVGIKAQSDLLQDAGERDVQGMQFRVFTADRLTAGQTLPVSLTGRPAESDAAGAVVDANSLTGLLVGLGAMGLALITVGVWFYRRRQAPRPAGAGDLEPAPAAAEDADTLIDAIIALDDLYRSGNLPEAAYRERRAELKAQLKGRME